MNLRKPRGLLTFRLPPLLAASTVLALGVGGFAAGPLEAQFRPPAKAQMELIADRTSYAPGESGRLAAQVSVDDGWHLQSHTPSFDYLIPTILKVDLPEGWPEAEVSYPAHKMWQSSFEADPLAVYEGQIFLLASFQVPRDASTGPLTLPVTLEYQACDDKLCLAPTEANGELVIDVGAAGEAVSHAAFLDSRTAAGPGSSRSTPLALMLGVALLGGLILNAMPCVLPILSLKLFGLVKTAGESRRAVTVGALATVAGILVSFWLLAGATLAARSAGEAIGWGIQFQNPLFVSFLAVVLTLFSLNMWGLFEIPLPGRLASAGSGGREGLSGHFASGVFATLMATPCSAPYLGTAVGFALSQSGATILLVFTAVGLGLGLPYLLLAAFPGTLGWMPKPGAWMETLRGVMGFLLAGTVVWLLYVLAAQTSSERLAFLEVGLLAIGLFAWAHRRFTGTARQRFATLGMVVASAAVLWIAGQAPAAATKAVDSKVLSWVDFDRTEAESLAADGRLVFVDVTADWCATCKVNERLVLETAATKELFDEHNVLAMKADWTNRNDDIANFLADYGRYAIPFYILYRPGSEPHIFGEVLRTGELQEIVNSSAAAAAAAGGS